MRRVFLGFILMTTFWGGSLMAVALRTGYLEGHIEQLQEFYAQEISAAFQEGERLALAAVKSADELNIEALEILFRKYPKADASNYARWVVEAASRYQVPTIILAGMMLQESSANPEAISNAGARGLTQVRWKHWGATLRSLGIVQSEQDLHDPRKSIEAGAAILGILLDRYQGDIQKALRHYSGGATRYQEKIVRRVVG